MYLTISSRIDYTRTHQCVYVEVSTHTYTHSRCENICVIIYRQHMIYTNMCLHRRCMYTSCVVYGSCIVYTCLHICFQVEIGTYVYIPALMEDFRSR